MVNVRLLRIAACHVGIAIHDCVGVGLHTSGHGWRASEGAGIGIKAESSRQVWGQGVSQRTIATTGFWQGERGNRGVNGVGLVGNVCALREAWGSVSHCRRIDGDGERQTGLSPPAMLASLSMDCVGVGLHTSGHGWYAREGTGIGSKAESSRQGWGQGVS